MRSLFKSKSKFLAGICCLCLGVASLFAGAFSFAKAPASADEVADTAPGFYVEQGASIRYDDVVSGIRFEVSLTKAQWETFYAEGNYADDVEVVFKAEIHFANRLNQDGTTSDGHRVVDHTVTVKTLNDYFAKAENVGKPFTVKPAILLSSAWADETAKSQEELYKMYADMEFYLTGAGIFVNDEAIAVKTVKSGLVNKDYTLRSVRSVAASLLAKGVVADEDVAVTEGFIKNADGTVAEIVTNDVKSYYDKYVDSGKVDVSAVDSAVLESADKVTIGSTKASASAIVDGEATITGSASTLTDGKTYIVNYDCGDTIYSFQGLTAATEIFYQANGVARLNARFAQTKSLDDVKASAVVETVVKDGVEYSATFYGVDRGYYVLGSDIDFGGSWVTSVSQNNSIYHTGGDYRTLSGLVGFGGTFDGNGYSIRHIRFNQNNSTAAPLGLFGNLAYGAKIKNLGMVDSHLRDMYHQKNNNTTALLANSTGYRGTASASAKDGTAAKDTYNYLVAKFGEDNWGVEIDNCYFGVDKTTLGDVAPLPAPRGKFNNSEDPIFTLYKADSNTYIYKQGQFGVTLEGEEGYITFKNSILDLPKNNDRYGQYNNGGYGWVSTITYASGFYNKYGSNANLGILENCYQITEEADTGRIMGGHNFNVTVGYTTSGAWDNQSRGTILIDYNDDQYIKLAGSITIYAANDFADVADGARVYDWYDTDTEKWLFCADAEELAKLGKTANTTIYHYPGLNRYDDFVDMSINNKNDLSAFNSNWEVVDGALIWKGLAEASAEKTLTLELSSEAIGVGDTIEVTAKYNEKDVTERVTLSTDNASVITINNVDKAFKVEKGGEATLYVTAGGYTAEYTIIASSVNQTAVTVSSNYSAVYGLDDTYSVPYVANGKDLVATDFLTLYREQFGNNDATVSAVYLLDETGAKTALDAVDVEGTIQYAIANAGNVKKALNIIVDGSEGYMSFADISSVTAVITDTAGFKYIPSTVTTRAGYYVLGNDFDNANGYGSSMYYASLGLLGTKGHDNASGNGNNRVIGYSFGALNLERLATLQSKWTDRTDQWKFAYDPFVGTFDGLGHTVDNIRTESFGLLGNYYDLQQSSTLMNVKFTNVRTSCHTWMGTYVSSSTQANGLPIVSKGYSSAILGTHQHAPIAWTNAELVNVPPQIKLENVVIEMATFGHETDQYNYGGQADYERFAFFNWKKYVDVNADTYSLKNVAHHHRCTNKYDFDNVVIKYNVRDYHYSVSDANAQMGLLFAYDDASYNVSGHFSMVYGYIEMDGVYLISAPSASGRAQALTAGRYSYNSTNYAYITLASNDFDKFIAQNPLFEGKYYTLSANGQTFRSTLNSMNHEIAPTVGAGVLTTDNGDDTTTSEFIFVPDIANYTAGENQTFTQFKYNNRSPIYVVESPFYRYNDYAAMANAGVTQVGNFAVSADGIVWSPAN